MGVPFSDPLADGPAIQAAGERALEAGATFEKVLDEVAAPLAQEIPVVAMCYANPLIARGFERAVGALAERGVSGLIVPDMPAARGGRAARGLRPGRHRLGAAGRSHDAAGRGASGSPRSRAASSTWCRSPGVTGERAGCRPELAEVVAARAGRRPTCPWRSASASARPSRSAQVGEIADGVIVGSRLVRGVLDAPTFEEGLADIRSFLRDSAAG